MLKRASSEKGVAMLIVIGTLMVVMILANVILQIMSNQSRLTHHQLSRIQAYYAGMAGINYALEKLRQNDAAWTVAGNHVITENFPSSIASVTVSVGDPVNSPISGTRTVSATVDYTGPTN